MTKKQQKDQDAEHALKMLKGCIKEGQTVYHTLKRVSSSGMYRHIDFFVINDNRPQRISYWMAQVGIGTYKDNTESLGVGGCGMDMGFHCVYTLARILFKDSQTEEKKGDAGYLLESSWI